MKKKERKKKKKKKKEIRGVMVVKHLGGINKLTKKGATLPSKSDRFKDFELIRDRVVGFDFFYLTIMGRVADLDPIA